jgi:predicted transcriptional regulator
LKINLTMMRIILFIGDEKPDSMVKISRKLNMNYCTVQLYTKQLLKEGYMTTHEAKNAQKIGHMNLTLEGKDLYYACDTFRKYQLITG